MTQLTQRPNVVQNAFQATVNGSKGRIEIYGDIFPAEWGGIDETTIVAALNEMPNVTELEIRVNSGGGDVYIGWAIRNRLAQHSATKTVYIDGIAASSAATIAMTLGGEIIMPTLSQVMFHESMCFLWGNKTQIRQRLKQIENIDAACVKALAEITGKPESDFKPWFANNAETWLSPAEAKEAGFNVIEQGVLKLNTEQHADSRPRLIQFSKAPATAVALLSTIPDGAPSMATQKTTETKPTENTPAPANPSTTNAPAPTQGAASTPTASTPAPGGAGVSLPPTPALGEGLPTPPTQTVTMSKDDLAALVSGAVTTAVTQVLATQKAASDNEEIVAVCQLAGCSAEQTQSYIDRKFSLPEVRQLLATQLNGKETPPAGGGASGADPHQKYRAAYQADEARLKKAGITVEQYIRNRCLDDEVEPPAKTEAK